MILLECPCCGHDVDEHLAPGLYINARLSLMSDIMGAEAQIKGLSKKDKEYEKDKARLDARLASLRADLAELQEGT